VASPKKTQAEAADKTEVADSDTLNTRMEEAKSSAPVLVIISGKPLGKSFFLTKPKMVLGRDLIADISLIENAISRKHTEFLINEEGIISIKDLGSTNGTFINDQKMESKEEKELEDGDLIRCGNTILKYLEEGQMENVHYNKMYNLATKDDMTGALNKKAVLDVISDEFARARKNHFPLSLMFFDFDHFKKTNDTFGHLAGDFVLKTTCNLIMSRLIRQKDALGRYGGEEFALVLRETPLKIAIEVAERVRTTIEKHVFKFDDLSMPVTISIGVVTMDSTTKSPKDLLALADKALYEAKSQGRNRVCVR